MATISQASPSVEFLARARNFHLGLCALSAGGPELGPAAQFLGAWTLELTLKAYISGKGVEPRELGHNLAGLWAAAFEAGLPIDKDPPRWCVLLASLHDKPYQLRYPTAGPSWIGPNNIALCEELRKLLASVGEVVMPGAAGPRGCRQGATE
jgi:hypothetical protein